MVSYENTKLLIAPLVPEAEQNEDLLTDTSSLGSALPDAEILPRETPWSTQLHAIATEELQAFAGIKEAILGVGSFDPPEDESEWRLLASR